MPNTNPVPSSESRPLGIRRDYPGTTRPAASPPPAESPSCPDALPQDEYSSGCERLTIINAEGEVVSTTVRPSNPVQVEDTSTPVHPDTGIDVVETGTRVNPNGTQVTYEIRHLGISPDALRSLYGREGVVLRPLNDDPEATQLLAQLRQEAAETRSATQAQGQEPASLPAGTLIPGSLGSDNPSREVAGAPYEYRGRTLPVGTNIIENDNGTAEIYPEAGRTVTVRGLSYDSVLLDAEGQFIGGTLTGAETLTSAAGPLAVPAGARVVCNADGSVSSLRLGSRGTVINGVEVPPMAQVIIYSDSGRFQIISDVSNIYERNGQPIEH